MSQVRYRLGIWADQMEKKISPSGWASAVPSCFSKSEQASGKEILLSGSSGCLTIKDFMLLALRISSGPW